MTEKDIPFHKAELIAKWNPYASNDYARFFDPGIMFGLDFLNIVITNPPYIRQEDIPDKVALRESGYKVFNPTSDIYTYFYELAANLLCEGGIAAFITSRSWMRAQFGIKLRTMLSSATSLHSIIDFGGYQVFESASVDTNILIFEKKVPDSGHAVPFVNMDKNFDGDHLEDYFYSNQQLIPQSSLKANGWTLADARILRLKEKIESMGKPLKNWNVNIYRGILTGCNEAFIIDTPTKERLCAEDPRSAEVIKPILRGRDIHRYRYDWAGRWLIIIPSGWTDENRGDNRAEAYFSNKYPGVYKHFIRVGALNTKGKGLFNRDDQGDYWWELRDCNYYNTLEGDKIIWADIAHGSCFHWDDKGYYISNTAYMLTGSELKSLLGILNSKLYDFYFGLISSGLSAKANRGFKIFIEQFPVPENHDLHNLVEEEVVSMLQITDVDRSDSSMQSRLNAATFENTIDRLVYELYELTPEEIALVENYGKEPS
ncbi:MAG: hypothetical protein CVU48_07935 [Candidatus Cloacimonetes bacterium HGW-Cloacimonetes-1]|nr:MAG: hypothetical protein CVU48_07935 [Candidatus Cloacimonetes bacterium HGW-Cloacimonetes-1]